MTTSKDGALPLYADPTRFSSLSDFYARLASSDAVLNRVPMLRKKSPTLLVTTSPVVSAVENGGLLPMVSVDAEATIPERAITLARSVSNAFLGYLVQQQTAAGIPHDQRVIVQVLNRADKVTVVKPRKKTIPILVFVAVMGAVIGTALILENLRPRTRVMEQATMPRLASPQVLQRETASGVERADTGR